jgi:hypothetical protein
VDSVGSLTVLMASDGSDGSVLWVLVDSGALLCILEASNGF